MRFEITDELRHNIVSMYADGATWLDSIDETVAQLEAQWSIRCHGVHKSSMSFVTNADRYGAPFAVLKLLPPNSGFFQKEHRAHQAFGDSIAPMIESDTEIGAMLVTRVTPGDGLNVLAQHDDVQATSILAECVRRIWRPVDAYQFPTVASLLEDFDQYRQSPRSDLIPADLVTSAHRMFQQLVETQTDQVLLHGDLHHANILNNGDGWTIIDPQGLIGEREYGLSAAMRNPFQPLIDSSDLLGLAQRRAAQYAQALGLNEERILQWTFVQTVLSLCWQALDGRPIIEPWLNYAKALANAI